MGELRSLDHGHMGCGVGGRRGRITQSTAELAEIGFELLADQVDAVTVDDKIGAMLGEFGVLIDAVNVVQSGSFASGAGRLDDLLNGLIKAGMLILLGDAQTAGKIVGADQNGVQFRNGKNG